MSAKAAKKSAQKALQEKLDAIKAAEKRGEYKYTKLKDCNQDGEVDLFHFYAVVLDASFPHKSFKSDRYIVTLKIADPDQSIDKEGVVEHCTLMMFAKKFEDLPICQRVGDIIRVHRAHV
jgi:Telomeric single stranded DNA binding POT1/CDC13